MFNRILLGIAYGLTALLAFPPAGSPASFESPSRVVANQEGGFAPFALYSPLVVAPVPGSSTALLLWIEKRFGTQPFSLDLFGKHLDAAGPGPDQYLVSPQELIPAESIALAVASSARVHIFYPTRLQGESRLMHRSTDSSLTGGTEQALYRGPRWVGQPVATVDGAGRPIVVYRRGSDLLLQSVPSHRTEPLVLSADARPTSFAVVAIGNTCFVAVTSNRREDLPDRLRSRIELFEVRDEAVVSRNVLAETPGLASSVTLATSAEGRLAIAWADDRFSGTAANTEIYGRIRLPGGDWLPEQRYSFTGNESFEPSLVWDRDEILHIVWQDNGFDTYEIVHRTQHQENGFDVVSTLDGAHSVSPKAILLDGRLAIVWRDGREGTADLFWSRQTASETKP